MEVKEFVKTILKEVSEAISESDSETACFDFNRAEPEGIEFDLAVVSKTGTEGKIGAEIFAVGAKTQGNISKEVVNRIKFKVYPRLRIK